MDVAKQDHYARFKIEPKDFILKNKLNWIQGNIIKYACRYPYKHKSAEGKKQDLEKIIVYAGYAIEELTDKESAEDKHTDEFEPITKWVPVNNKPKGYGVFAPDFDVKFKSSLWGVIN